MLTHRNFVSTISAAISIIPGISENDIYIAYLPLAHSLELVIENGVIAIGNNDFLRSTKERRLFRICKSQKST